MNKDLKSRANPHCSYCLGQGVRHNGYFSYPCNCAIGRPLLDSVYDAFADPTPKKVFSLPHYHKSFGSLDNNKLNMYLDFLAEVLWQMNSFTVWEAENCHSEEDDEKWSKEVIERFTKLIDLRNQLDDKIVNDGL